MHRWHAIPMYVGDKDETLHDMLHDGPKPWISKLNMNIDYDIL